MTSQTELVFFQFFELVTRYEKNYNKVLELVTGDFETK